MNAKILEMVDHIIDLEGGYVNDPADSGGPTNYGVTQATLSDWLGEPATVDDVKNLDRQVAVDIFVSRYYLQPRINLLPEELQLVVFDMSINHGQVRAAKLFQLSLRALGYAITNDGIIGMRTQQIANKALSEKGLKSVMNMIVDVRNSYYHSIVANKPSQKKFINGWLNRSNSFRIE